MSKTVQWVEQVETWVLFDPMDFCSAKIYSESRVDENSPMEFHVRGGGKLTKNGKRYIYIYTLDQPFSWINPGGCKNPTIWDSLVKVG